MPPSTWIFRAVAPMAANYLRNRYRRRAGNLLYRRFRRSFKPTGGYLRGTRRLAIKAKSKPMLRGTKKRGWARAMGTNTPSVRTRYVRSRFNELGIPTSSHTSRRHKVTYSKTGESDKTLIAEPLVSVPFNDDDTRMNVRNGRLVNVSGVKFRCWFQIKNQAESSTKLNQPLQIRWAILNPRDNTGNATDVTTGTNFFIHANPSSTDDAADFPSGTGDSFRLMNRAINKRRYAIVQEGTFIIQNDPASNNTRVDMQSKKFISLWLPIKKQMKWSNNGVATGDEYPNTNLFFAWWYCEQGSRTTTTAFPTSNDSPIEWDAEAITYFRNAPVMY